MTKLWPRLKEFWARLRWAIQEGIPADEPLEESDRLKISLAVVDLEGALWQVEKIDAADPLLICKLHLVIEDLLRVIGDTARADAYAKREADLMQALMSTEPIPELN
jgi:hypothetical protein